MLHRSVVPIVGSLATCAALAAAQPAWAGSENEPPPQRHIVFSVHQDITTRKVVRSETDISQAFNGTGASNHVGMGGGTAKGIESNAVDEDVSVDVVAVSPEGILGCNVTVAVKGESRTAPTRVWIGADGAVRWTDPARVGDPSLTFLLSLLATHLLPAYAGSGTTWKRGGENFHLDVLTDDVAKVSVDGRFGTGPAHGGTETGSVEYATGLLVPIRAEVDVRGRDEQPMQSAEYHRHVVYALVSDSKGAKR